MDDDKDQKQLEEELAQAEHDRVRTMVTFAIMLILLFLLFFYYGLRALEMASQKPMTRGDITLRYGHEDLLEYQGRSYRRRRDATAILILGIDDADDTEISPYRRGGQADFLCLMIFDDAEKTITPVQIDRDSIAPVTVLGVLGNEAGIRDTQISLAHSFGADEAQLCQLTLDAVSRLMSGIKTDAFISFSLGAIASINDLAGGVTVTLDEDFTRFDPAMTVGTTMTLRGQQAEYYVRGRLGIGDGSNTERMARQQRYLSALIDRLADRVREGATSVNTLYDRLSRYLFSDLSKSKLVNTAWSARDYLQNPVLSLPAEIEEDSNGFPAVHVASEQAMDMLIPLLYKEISSN